MIIFRNTIAALVVPILLCTHTLQASVLVVPTGAVANNTYSTFTPGQTIDGSGLSDASIVEAGDTVPATWPSHGIDGATQSWLSPGILNIHITFDLGAVTENIEGFHLWNYNAGFGNIDRGFQTATINISDDNTTWTTLDGNGAAAGVDFTFAKATGSTTTYTGETYTFDGQYSFRYLQMTNVVNYGKNDFTGLSEIRFIQAVPEPTTLWLILLSCLIIMAVKKRREVCLPLS